MGKNKITKLKFLDPNKATINIIKSDYYLKEVQSMSDFIQTLKLTPEQNKKLVNRLVEYDKNVRIDALIQVIMNKIEIKEN